MNRFYKSFLLLWFSHIFMDFFTGIWPIYKTIAGIDLAKAGLIAGISGFLGEILQIGFGYFSDRGHRKKVLLFGLLFSSAILWITFANGIFNSFLLLLLLMVGSGSYHPAAVGMIGILSKQRKGRGILFFASGGAIGYAVSQLAFTKLVSVFQGHAIILLAPLSLVLIMLAFHRFPMQENTRPSLSLSSFFEPIKHCRKPLFLLYLTQVTSQLLIVALLFLLPDFLRAKGCHSWFCMGGGHYCFVLGSALTMIPAGYLSDKYGQKAVLLVALSASSLLLYLLLSFPTLSFSAALILLSTLGAFLGVVNPVIVSWGNRLVPESPSTVSALLMGFAWCVGNLGSSCAGLIATCFQENCIANTLSSMGTCLAIALFFIVLMPRPETVPSMLPEETDVDN